MSECNNCYEGCTEIVSDKCVRYTGPNIELLGIENNDPLALVEAKIFEFLEGLSDGSNIVFDSLIDNCGIILNGGEPNLINIINVIINNICTVYNGLEQVGQAIGRIEDDYTIGACLSGVNSSSGTHDILQAVINQLCLLDNAVKLLTNLSTSYAKKDEINTYIANYLANQPSVDKHYKKMIPYAAVEFYGDLNGKFDLSGKGIGDWEQIYLCNGKHGTPNKVGRFPVGANVPGGNCTTGECYNLNDTGGQNFVTLIESQMPNHSHTITMGMTDPGHQHLFANDDIIHEAGYVKQGNIVLSNYKGYTDPRSHRIFHFKTMNLNKSNENTKTGITFNPTIGTKGGNQKHENRPPYLACYYIMHIPD